MTEKESDQPETTNGARGGASGEFLPPLDFTSIVFPLYAQALVKLGLLKDPANAGGAVNLDLARRMIDLLDLLKVRTHGNLKPEEQTFLETCLQQLRLAYVEKAKIRG